MKYFRKIQTIFFLSIYVLIILHSALPHVHLVSDHGHEGHEHTTDHQHVGHNHAHLHVTESDEGWVSDLLRVLGHLDHPDVGTDHFEKYTTQSDNPSINIGNEIIKDVQLASFDGGVVYWINPEEGNDVYDPPPNRVKQFFSVSNSHRGPPAVV